jgi:predicted O-linked N-acetylglucosamine transferase (SPINDLY family)
VPVGLDPLFLSPDLFGCAVAPGSFPAWRRLQLGDPEGAEFFAGALSEDEAGIAGLACLKAAISASRGDSAAALPLLRAALPRVSDPAEIAALSFLAGLAAFDLGDAAAGRLSLAAAVAARDDAAIWAAWARCERAAGSPAAAVEKVLAEALAHHPDHPDLLNVRAAQCLGERRFAEALAALDRLPAAFAEHPLALVNRGGALRGLSRFVEARDCFARAVAAAPELAAARLGAALAAFEAGDDAAAEPLLRGILAETPDQIDAAEHLARLLARTRRAGEAKDLLRDLLSRVPDGYAARYRLALLLHEEGDYDGALAQAEAALELRPEALELHDLIGLSRLACGEIDAAQRSFGIAAALDLPQASAYASNRIYALHYDPRVSPADLFAAHRAYETRFGGVGDDPAAAFANSPDPERRLRVGYVSPDFRAHSVAFFMAAVVDGHRRRDFEVVAYGNVARSDKATRWFREGVDLWREVSGMTFAALRETIRDDRIDILVDLAGHTGDNLLPLFARRAAPVQVNWLGYPDTTGLAAMDYRLVDALTDPPGEADAFAAERLVRLPRPFLCYRPTADLPPVAAGPLAAGLPMTFGSFNTAMKLNDPLFDAWAEILRGVPEARLLLKAKQFASPRTRAWATDALAARGVSPERVTALAFAPTLGAHLDLYGGIDLALDTFPYNGTTTTCEALAMGVPVLSPAGDRHCARVGGSLLAAVGLTEEFLACDVADYVRRAVAFAARRNDLAARRGDLRRRLLASPLCDEAGFVAALEAAYRTMWRTWCAGGPRCGLGPSPFEQELRVR